ncbi:MAG TPA: hypothetical protein VHT73_19405 [Thermodesulfobacteriota bacterium]|nr:hypothetical protein [Thermodesulfobacteriota bacterium]
MREIMFTSKQLKEVVKFTDPIMLIIQKEEEILECYNNGTLKPPFLVEDNSQFLIFNGNHRVLVAINNKLNIKCKIIETDEDIALAQAEEGEGYRDLTNIDPLTMENVLKELRKSANMWSSQRPEDWVFE